MKNPKERVIPKRAIKEVRKVGNSLGVILPKLMSQDLVQPGTMIQIVRLGRFLIISPVPGSVSFEEEDVQAALRDIFSSS